VNRCILAVLCILYPNFAYADNSFLRCVTLHASKKCNLTYSGILGALADEYVRFLSKKWEDDVDFYWNYGSISYSSVILSLKNLNECRNVYSSGSWSDKRKYWWHYSSEWAPVPFPTYVSGRQNDVINVGPIRVTSKFKFKLKDIYINLAGNWSAKVRPSLHFTSKIPLVRSLATSLILTKSASGMDLVSLTIRAGTKLRTYSDVDRVKSDEARCNYFVEVVVELPSW